MTRPIRLLLLWTLVGIAGLAGILTALYRLPVSVALGPCLRDWTSPTSYRPRVSPLASTSLGLGGGSVKVCYGKPSARGRVVFGDVVPWGRLWRLGANEPTRLFTNIPLDVAGVAIAPGRYSLYAVPGPETWEVALNRSTFHWGLDFSEHVLSREIGRVRIAADSTEGHVETLTLGLEPESETRAALVIEWERTRVRVPILAR